MMRRAITPKAGLADQGEPPSAMSATTLGWFYRWSLHAVTGERIATFTLLRSNLSAHGAHKGMWNSARNEIRELAYLAAMVSGLSVFGAGLAVALVVVGLA